MEIVNVNMSGLLAAAILRVAVLASCASGPSIRSADFTSYRTFGCTSELGTDRAAISALSVNCTLGDAARRTQRGRTPGSACDAAN